MRIIGGTHRGRHLSPAKGFKARPTTDFAKENLFNVLGHLVAIEGARVLDLFSGTGSIAYEFASRGAAGVIAIEADYHHYSFIKHVARELHFTTVKVYRADVFLACRKLAGKPPFDVVFADPPYDLPRVPDLPAVVFDNHLLAPDGVLVIEHPATTRFADHPRLIDHRHYGSVNFSLFRAPATGEEPLATP